MGESITDKYFWHIIAAFTWQTLSKHVAMPSLNGHLIICTGTTSKLTLGEKMWATPLVSYQYPTCIHNTTSISVSCCTSTDLRDCELKFQE